MAERLTWLSAPAKINLHLSITGRRENGYHTLESVIIPLDFGDTMEVRISDSDRPRLKLITGAPLNPCRNTLIRAFDLFCARVPDFAFDLEVRLHKNIPISAGLGGGSSDAASILKLMNELSRNPLPADQIRSLALEIGADVPFFLTSGPAWVTGVGEDVRPLSAVGVESHSILLVNPRFPLSTHEVFQSLGQSEWSTGPRLTQGEVERDGLDFRRAVNDLTLPACRIRSELGVLLDQLAETSPLFSALSGSGATCFALYESDEQAARAQLNFPACWSVIARPANHLKF